MCRCSVCCWSTVCLVGAVRHSCLHWHWRVVGTRVVQTRSSFSSTSTLCVGRFVHGSVWVWSYNNIMCTHLCVCVCVMYLCHMLAYILERVLRRITILFIRIHRRCGFKTSFESIGGASVSSKPRTMRR